MARSLHEFTCSSLVVLHKIYSMLNGYFNTFLDMDAFLKNFFKHTLKLILKSLVLHMALK